MTTGTYTVPSGYNAASVQDVKNLLAWQKADFEAALSRPVTYAMGFVPYNFAVAPSGWWIRSPLSKDLFPEQCGVGHRRTIPTTRFFFEGYEGII